MRKLGFLLVAITFVVIMAGCSNNKDKDSLKFKKDYEALNSKETTTDGVYYRNVKIDEHNPIVYTTFKEVKQKIENNESFILYVGFSACPWCRSVIPYIIEEAKKNDIDKIYYINVREDNTKESDLRGYYKLDENNNVVYDIYPDKYYHDVLNTLDDFLKPYVITDEENNPIMTGENRLYAPSLIAYENGIPTILDECISDKQKDGYQKLTSEIIRDMREKINNVFKVHK